MPDAYRTDLAHIHDAGFGQLAEHAGLALVAELERAGFRTGLVVDLGCGSGGTARRLHDEGYRVLGIDASEALLERARARVPEAEFRHGWVARAELPACVAVTAIGEVFSYAFDEADVSWDALFARIHAALEPGGLLLFDVADRDRAPEAGRVRTFAEGEDWAVLMEAESDPRRTTLTRHITTFRRIGETYRRDHETHRLHLADADEVVSALERTGFEVRRWDGYGEWRLPRGLGAYLARKREPDGRQMRTGRVSNRS